VGRRAQDELAHELHQEESEEESEERTSGGDTESGEFDEDHPDFELVEYHRRQVGDVRRPNVRCALLT
jgi:hypothetical protein